MLWRVMLSATVVLGLQFLFPLQGNTQVACGSVIITNAGLTGDLDCSNYQYDPLHIDADNVTFNLNGYTLTCSSQWGWVYTGYENDVEGIRVTSHSGVKILGPGKITNCGRAVTLSGGVNNEVRGLTLSGNLTGIVLVYQTDLVVRNNVIVGNLGNGIDVSDSANAQVVGNYIAGNVGWGMGYYTTNPLVISGNYILGNQEGGFLEAIASSLSAQITGNIILGNGTYDLNLSGTEDILTGTICETSVPAGLCPYPLPRFPFDIAPKGRRK